MPGAKNGGSDKGPDGNRIDSIPIANGCIKAGAACDMLLYDANEHDAFAAKVPEYDAYIVRINPGQLSQGTPEGTQARFDALMRSMQEQGKLVWSSPDVQTKMGAKDALCKIANMGCGLVDTFAYYDEASLTEKFKQTCAYQPRVIKQNRGSAGEGIWLCWLVDGEKNMKPLNEYPAKTFGEVRRPPVASSAEPMRSRVCHPPRPPRSPPSLPLPRPPSTSPNLAHLAQISLLALPSVPPPTLHPSRHGVRSRWGTTTCSS